MERLFRFAIGLLTSFSAMDGDIALPRTGVGSSQVRKQ